ncbi:hypothetical protein DTX80_16530 [Bacilli bacterium]|nr:hypothetical protein WH51_15050 [Bacilli bacterium VT-13-104]PZD82971.1 hypothetical protein DEJ64_16900 [Bacilli bacterium]PZD83572.1 hypothetical protein DEJ60_16800 [Bacilli bacterium]PZD85370.1 hypothetical protein DEJ66_16965 [Bacilli bacterium]RCO04507.1 hypothetical protein DTX80_16530 [Bacilli bacterium]
MSDNEKEKLIPFYRYQKRDTQGYTLFLDVHSQRVYKVIHKEGSGVAYWIAFALVLGIMRAIQDIHLPISNLVNLIIVIVLGILSVLSGVFIYKNYYKDLKEIYPTKDMIEDYIYEAKGLLIKEVIVTIIVSIAVIVFFILFLVSYRLMWLLFSYLLLSGVVVAICGLPKARFELYKERR